ncbi:hypothetical protein MNEG_3114 [Monoraphidium neglectum]|uniref:Uncharacterized protein n=1 Tax=Monoraphidium neglectum TaxID=145388 RepID=A0A0D2K2S2_9CHLO|nr:hypothetical protein MNEG_3114 [Monoraphidium neglectum]KIZ04843.1 hypothetical protein MNEG_3114 [Monoraphidium neglectum]|eukprot:XP_013903862.1 hypothetical protein MNEG_3114 [Monoraphidium neglectum]
MARLHWALTCALALLLAPGALGASLKAGGLTAYDRRALGEQAAASANANIMAFGGRTAGFAPSDRAPITNFGGMTTFTNAGVGFNGGTTTSFDNFGNPVANEGGRGQIFRHLGEQAAASADANIMAFGGRTAGFAPSDRAPIANFGGMTTFTNAGVGFNGGTTTSFDNFGNPVANEGGRGQIFRRLGEQAAASADANIMAFGGRTAGFAPSDRAPITNFGGMTTFTNAGVGFNGGTTTSFDNFGNPVANEGGRGQIFRRLGEQAAAATVNAQGGAAFTDGANPTIVSSSPPANAGAAMNQATFAQQQQWAQQAVGGFQQQQQWAQQMMDATPQMQQWQQLQQQRQNAVAAAAAAKSAGQGSEQGLPKGVAAPTHRP